MSTVKQLSKIIESLNSKKFTVLTEKEKDQTLGGLSGTFWIGDTNVNSETGSATDPSTRWSEDSSSNSDDINQTLNDDSIVTYPTSYNTISKI